MGIVKIFKGFFIGNFSMMWDGVKQIFFSVVGMVIKLVFNLVDGIIKGWYYIRDKVGDLVYSLWKKVIDKFFDIVEGVKVLLGKMGDGIKSMVKYVLSGIILFSNLMIDKMVDVVNGVIGGVNWVFEKVGVFIIFEWKLVYFKVLKYV